MTINDDPKTFLFTNEPCGVCGGSCHACGSNYCLMHGIERDTCLFCRAGLPVEAGRTAEMIESFETLALATGKCMAEIAHTFAEIWNDIANRYPLKETPCNSRN